MDKIGVKNVAGLVIYAVRNNIYRLFGYLVIFCFPDVQMGTEWLDTV